MGNRLFVGNIPFATSEDQLRDLFAAEGREVREVKIVTDRDTGRSRGFAFVEMGNDSQAQDAIAALNGRDLGGRKIVVNEAQERSGGRGGGGAGGSRPAGRGPGRGGSGRSRF